MIPHSRPTLTERDSRALSEALASGMLATGSTVAAFEVAVSERYGMGGGVATASGTAAIMLGLKMLGIAAGDEVIIPTYVCHDVLQAITAVGATPVLVDIDSRWRQPLEPIARAVTSRTAAVVIVHIFGFMSGVSQLSALGVPVISDCCQAFGGRHDALPDIAICSFSATKCLTTGTGGMCLFRDAEQADRGRAIRDDATNRFPVTMSDLSARLGLSQLAQFDDFVTTRRHIATRYLNALADVDATLPTYGPDDIPFRFPLRTARGFEAVVDQYAAHSVAARRGVDALLHRGMGLDDSEFPNASALFGETVSIPLYPSLSDAQIERVVAASLTALR